MSFSSSSFAPYSYSEPESHYPPTPSGTGTLIFLGGLFLAYVLMPRAADPSTMARTVSIIVTIALAVSIFLDSRRGLRNLFRADLLCLIGLHFLTLTEFLFPQPGFDAMLSSEQTVKGLSAILLGMGGLTIGRQLVAPKPMQSSWLKFGDISDKLLFRVFIVAAFLGYYYMLTSVNFDVIRMVDEMLKPRFSQSWTRARIGGWLSFVTELSLLITLIPPLAGIIWNRRKSFPFYQLLIVLIIFIFTLFQSFAGGTRNALIGNVATFLTAYLLTLPKNTVLNTLVPTVATSLVTVYASYYMLEFRTIGLQNYLADQVYASGRGRESLAVDLNLANVGLIVDAFPKNHDFLGWEILIWAIIRPFPRALWAGKPEGLSVSIEEVVGANGWTVSGTFVGESYMMGGYFAVIGMAIALGALAAWWNRLALQKHSGYAMLVYAIGFLAAAVTMRSMFWLTTLILPILAIVLVKKIGILR